MQAVDINDDGHDDIVFGNSSRIGWMDVFSSLNDSNVPISTAFIAHVPEVLLGNSHFTSFSVGDADGDGDMDLVAAFCHTGADDFCRDAVHNITVFEKSNATSVDPGYARNGYIHRNILSVGPVLGCVPGGLVCSHVKQVAFADFNSDDEMDIFVRYAPFTDSVDDKWTWLRRIPGMWDYSFTAEFSWPDMLDATIADISGDGMVDVVVFSEQGLVIFENVQEAAAFAVAVAWSPPVTERWDRVNSLTIRDVDGDGNLDAIVSGQVDIDVRQFHKVLWLLNPGDETGVWTAVEVTAEEQSGPGGSAAGDFDNDGDVDIVHVHSARQTVVFDFNVGFGGMSLQGAGSGNAWSGLIYDDDARSYREVVVTDIDRDGDEDVFVRTDEDLYAYINKCAPGHRNAGPGSCVQCDRGRFAAAVGSTSCSDCGANTVSPDAATACETTCPPGTYHDTTSPQGCAYCQAGRYADTSGLLSCKACEPNSYSFEGATACIDACPDGSYGSSAQCILCPIGKYKGSDNSCTLCVAGRFQSETGRNEERFCSACSAGTFSGTGSGDCTDCGAGRYTRSAASASCEGCASGKASTQVGAQSSDVCQDCARGRFSEASSSSCTACAPGKFQNATARSFCDFCEAGQYTNVTESYVCNDCASGYFSATGATECRICPAGFACESGTLEACLPGRYSEEGGGSCVVCEPGYRCPGGSDRTACAPGSSQSANGSDSCNLCAAGSFQNASGMLHCLGCPEGHFCPPGASSPLPCGGEALFCPANASGVTTVGLGNYSTPLDAPVELRSGQAVCPSGHQCAGGSLSPCAASSFAPRGSTVCTPCARCQPGRYETTTCASDGSGDTTCGTCPSGRYQNSSGASACLPCPRGFACEEGSVTPLACLPGQYQDEEAASLCKVCSAGRYQDESSQESCLLCPQGAFCEAGATRVTECRPGYHQPTAGSSSTGACLACPPGRFQNESGGAGCYPCTPGSFCAAAAQMPSPCLPGTFQGASEASECASCPKDTYSSLTGVTSCVACPEFSETATTGSFSAESCKCLFGIESANSSSFSCVCPVGTYLDPGALERARMSSRGDDYGEVCVRCSLGMDCDAPGLDLGSLPLAFGFYRTRPASNEVLPCTDGGIACKGGTGTGDELCREGHKGPYCDVCDAGRFKNSASGTCDPCGSAAAHGTSIGLILLFLALLATLVVYCYQRHRHTTEHRSLVGEMELASARSSTGEAGGDAERGFRWSAGDLRDRRSSESKRPSVADAPGPRTASPGNRGSMVEGIMAAFKKKGGKGAGGTTDRTRQTAMVAGREVYAVYQVADDQEEALAAGRGRGGVEATMDNNAISMIAGLGSALFHPHSVGGVHPVAHMWVTPSVAAFRSLKTKLKVIISFLQIQRLVHISFKLPLPDVFIKFLAYFDVLQFTFFDGISGDCIFSASFLDGLIVGTATPTIVLLILYALYRYLPDNALQARFGVASARNLLSYVMLVITFMVLPTCTTLSLNTFLCETLDTHDPPGLGSEDKSYLVKDYSVECYTEKHRSFQVYAIFVLLLYPVGIPMFYAFLLLRRNVTTGTSVPQTFWRLRETQKAVLYKNSENFAKDDEKSIDVLLKYATVEDLKTGFAIAQKRMAHDAEHPHKHAGSRWRRFVPGLEKNQAFWEDVADCTPGLQRDTHLKIVAKAMKEQVDALRFLLESYLPACWWFEIFEAFRRLALTAFPLAFEPGTVGQQAAGVLLAMGFTTFYYAVRPYVTYGDDYLAAGTQAVVFLIFLYGLSETASASTFTDGQDDNIGALLIAINCMILAVGVYAVTQPLLVVFRVTQKDAGDKEESSGRRSDSMWHQSSVSHWGSSFFGRRSSLLSRLGSKGSRSRRSRNQVYNRASARGSLPSMLEADEVDDQDSDSDGEGGHGAFGGEEALDVLASAADAPAAEAERPRLSVRVLTQKPLQHRTSLATPANADTFL